MAPEPTAAPAPVVYVIYTVQEGDTVAGIASKYSISPMSIIWNNIDLENADMLALGQYLRVPTSDGILYDVRLGDTLLDIADQVRRRSLRHHRLSRQQPGRRRRQREPGNLRSRWQGAGPGADRAGGHAYCRAGAASFVEAYYRAAAAVIQGDA